MNVTHMSKLQALQSIEELQAHIKHLETFKFGEQDIHAFDIVTLNGNEYMIIPMIDRARIQQTCYGLSGHSGLFGSAWNVGPYTAGEMADYLFRHNYRKTNKRYALVTE